MTRRSGGQRRWRWVVRCWSVPAALLAMSWPTPSLPAATTAGRRVPLPRPTEPSLITTASAAADTVPTTRSAPTPRKRPKARPAAKRHHQHHRPAPKRAKVGERVPVEITYYCLQGTTRTDRPTRDGIVAADPRVFPLRRHVELFVRGQSLGRFLVDDTGGLIRGHIIDVWVQSCDDARRRGRRHGYAVLLKKGAVRSDVATSRP